MSKPATNDPGAVEGRLDRLTRLHPKLIDLSLGRVERLLGRLGDPHERLAPVVHVAGTNGKGSVIAFLRACLEAAGYRVHVAISPHLVRFNERIRLAGALISDAALIEVLEECESANRGEPITFFEITTVAALLAFARTPADVVLLETGLGGRLDATNVIRRPALCVLTPISIDHQQYLGETLGEIAAEKAGILKPGVTCVTTLQKPDAKAAIALRAARVAAPLVSEGADWTMTGGGNGLVFESAGGLRRFPPPNLHGVNQVQNAGTAVAALEHLADFTVGADAIARGMGSAEWPGRLQRLVRGPLVDRSPGGWEVWVDGGHNAAAAEVLAAAARAWSDKPLHLIFGMLNTKDPAAFLAPLAAAKSVHAVPIAGEPSALGADDLAAAGRALGMDAEPAAGVAEALESIIAKEAKPARVLVCGSLYLVGKVLNEHG